MKELETHLAPKGKESIEVNVKKRKGVEYTLMGAIKPRKGHFIWELNLETGEIKKAEFKKSIPVFGAKIPPKDLIIKPDCFYIPALNAENAKKKYLKDNEQSSYYSKESAMDISDITI